MAAEIRSLGLDPAGTSGYAIVAGSTLLERGEWTVGKSGWTKSPAASADAAKALQHELMQLLDNRATACDVLVCEDPTSRSRGISKAYGSLLSAVAGACFLTSTACVFVRPTQWKKEVIGAGNASKRATIDFASRYAGYRIESDNIADAVCLAVYGATVDDKNIAIPATATGG